MKVTFISFWSIFMSLIFIGICPWGNFCSIICGTSCTGDLKTNCGNCQSDGAWSKNGSTCVVNTAANWVLHDSTPDLGGSMTVSGASYNSTCFDFQVYGYVNPAQTITVSNPGITVPYYSMRVYLGILAHNSVCWGCPPGPYTFYWSNTSAFSILFNDPQGTETTNPVIYTIAKNYTTISGKCDSSSKNKSEWFRISRTYNYHTTNTLLNWSISCNQSNTTREWGIKQFLIIYQPCDSKCSLCFGAGPTKCTACNTTGSPVYWLSGTTCSATCLSGYGYSLNYTCVVCDKKCTSCYMVADNCSACTSSGKNASFLSTTANPNYTTCVTTCPAQYFGNKTTRTCDPCNTGCEACLNTATYCTKCDAGYYWTGWACYQTCPAGYFQDPNGANCTRCYPFCSACSGAYNICSTCVTSGSFTAYLFNGTTCMRVCPNGYYADNNGSAGPNICFPCNSTCTSCSVNASYCASCVSGYYLTLSTCSNTCPNGTIPVNYTGGGLCINCDIYCVSLTISMYFSDVLSEKIYIDMVFSQELNSSSFDMQSFQNITITSQNLQYTTNMFTFTYVNLSSSSYRIIIEPKSYIFLYNATFTVTTKAEPTPIDYSNLGIPFKSSVYQQTASLTWFLIKGPPFTNLESGIMTSFSKLSTKTNYVLTLPFVQQIKKSGVFSLLFSGAQATSLSILSNQIQSQNMYEGVRVWAIFIFFDVPEYEKISDKTKRFVLPTVQDQIRNAQQVPHQAHNQKCRHDQDHQGEHRQLFSTNSMYWRFQRTGQTSFFIYDVYIPIILIALCWAGMIVAHFSKRTKWYGSYAPHLYSAVHKIHEMSILYVTMASIVEFIYFEPSSFQRVVSAIICVAFNLYFIVYQLYIYYDFIKYPMAEIGSELYEYFVVRYGFFLRTIRFVEYDMQERWSPRHWFRPYNFHILSYYKKFLMIIALPLFYSITYAQMSVLAIIQFLEVIRFWFTWPFLSAKRNWFRLTLQFSLLLFFLINLIQISLLQTIMEGDAATIEKTATQFYALGWAGFAFCFYFNISFVCMGIHSLFVGLRDSNRTQMEMARRKYYSEKILSYERDNEASSKELVNEWIKLGNLNQKSYGELPQINVRIELYEFRKIGNKFYLLVKKITSLFMKEHAKLRKPNNTTVGNKIEKAFTFGESDNPRLYEILSGIYKTYEHPHVETIRLKTFLNVWQKDYKAGDSIVLDRNHMFQKVELISYENDSKEFQLKALMENFPIEQSIIIKSA